MPRRCGSVHAIDQVDRRDCYSEADAKVVEKLDKGSAPATSIAKLVNVWDCMHALFNEHNTHAIHLLLSDVVCLFSKIATKCFMS